MTSVVAGQVWRSRGADAALVVVGLRVDPTGRDATGIDAQLVEVGTYSASGSIDHLELPCNVLRDEYELVYDATLTEPRVRT